MTRALATAFDYEQTPGLRRQLKRLANEANAKKGTALLSMIEMGKAIEAAHELLANHGDGLFGDWCEAELGISRTSAHRARNTYLVSTEVEGMTRALPYLSSDTIDALIKRSVPTEARTRAIELANRGALVTPDVVRGLVSPTVTIQSTNGQETREASSGEPTEDATQDVPETIEDELGQPVPDRLAGIFRAANEFEAYARSLNVMKQWAKGIVETPAGNFLRLELIEGEIKQAQRTLRSAKPYALCPYCQTRKRSNCQACRGGGFITKIVYDQLPSEMRQ